MPEFKGVTELPGPDFPLNPHLCTGRGGGWGGLEPGAQAPPGTPSLESPRADTLAPAAGLPAPLHPPWIPVGPRRLAPAGAGGEDPQPRARLLSAGQPRTPGSGSAGRIFPGALDGQRKRARGLPGPSR